MSALAHLRVVECGSDVAAPFCARLFADLGAQVIKVEPPDGDPLRQRGPFPEDRPNLEQSGIFHFLNAGKEGVVANLDSTKGLDDLHLLLNTADVFIENLPSSDRQRWELDFDTIARRYPRLVVVSISAYGRTGPWADRTGTDLTVQAVSALPTAIGYPDRPPLPLPYDQADYQAGFHGMAAALCALHERERSGLGQGIDISSAQVLAYQVGAMSLVTAKRRIPWMRAGRTIKGALYPTGFFEVADGFICIATIHGRQWHGYLKLMGEPDWAKDEKNRDSLYMGAQDEGHPVDTAFRDWLKQHTQAEIMAIAEANGLIIGPVNDVDRVLASSQLAFRNQWGEIAVGGKMIRMPKPGYLFSATPATFGAAAPALGTGCIGNSHPTSANSKLKVAKTPRRAALDGVRVLDFGWNWAGPMAGQLLADMGAEVIRIETTLRPDNMRAYAHNSYFFCHNNRSKKSATFNIADPRGAELVRKLAEKCDIVMDNFAAGVMAKNGLGYEDLARANPNIIVVSMSMAGQEGPKRDMRGFAAISSGYAGLDHLVGYREDQLATSFMAFGLGDTAQAIQGVIGALVALVHRQQTGRGQFVDLGQTASMCASLAEPLIDYQLNGRKPSIRGDTHPHYVPHGIYKTRGDRWLALAVRDRADWQALCDILGRDDWRCDERLSSPAGRRIREAEIDEVIRDWCWQAERDEAVAELGKAGLPAAPVLELPEQNGHAVFAGRELTVHHSGGTFEPCTIYATPWRLTGTPAAVAGPTPAIGEQNDYVYGEILGLDQATIHHLQEEKVLV